MGEGNILLCVSVHTLTGGGYAITGLGGGVPHPRFGWWGVPQPCLDGGGVPRPGLDGGGTQGTPIRSGCWGGYPSQVLMAGGYPGWVPPTRSGWEGGTHPPIRQSSIASTCYAAGGVPLAFTQEDFLVFF